MKQGQKTSLQRNMQQKKKGSISKTMIMRLAFITIIINFLVLIVISTFSKSMLHSVETDYLSEVRENISNSIDKTMDEFMSIAYVLAQNETVIQMLMDSDKDNQLYEHEMAESIVNEMDKIASGYLDEILFIGIFDIEQDGYLMNDFSYSEDDFSFAEQPYYG
ncbi:MAG: hypothetical protein R3Y53_07725 [Bacillota bacterium]